MIQTQEVDILLTDIQMEDLTGIELLKTLKHPPVSIFTTAYSEYALEGYELDIIDYLVKPISFQRFCRAIDKAKELIRYNQTPEPEHSEVAQPNSYFFVKTKGKLIKVLFADILFVQSYGEYVKIYTEDDVHLALQTTSYMEEILPSTDFVRIHRSFIVNLDHVAEIEGNEVQVPGHRLSISKRMKEGFLTRIREKGII